MAKMANVRLRPLPSAGRLLPTTGLWYQQQFDFLHRLPLVCCVFFRFSMASCTQIKDHEQVNSYTLFFLRLFNLKKFDLSSSEIRGFIREVDYALYHLITSQLTWITEGDFVVQVPSASMALFSPAQMSKNEMKKYSRVQISCYKHAGSVSTPSNSHVSSIHY